MFTPPARRFGRAPVHRRRPAPAAGFAALAIVLVLFFVMAMVAAYANRNLIFEQRVAANSYRAERSMVAADSAIDWALTLLNGGRVDANCQPSVDGVDEDLRTRLLEAGSDGSLQVKGTIDTPLFAGCVSHNGVLTCFCPSLAQPSAAGHAATSWDEAVAATAFAIQLSAPGGEAKRAAVSISARGCGSPGLGDTACVGPRSRDPVADGVTRIRATLGLLPALPEAPAATVTAVGNISTAGAALLELVNADPRTALTAHAGGSVSRPVGAQFKLAAGATGDGVIDNDAKLGQVPAGSALSVSEVMFVDTFGMTRDAYREQPGVVRLACAAGCGDAQLNNALAAFPGRTVYVDGALSLTSGPAGGVAWGSATQPLHLVVDGTLAVSTPATFIGMLYAETVQWNAAAGQVQGALVSAGNVIASATLRASYAAEPLRRIVDGYGSFVRTPGGWVGRPN